MGVPPITDYVNGAIESKSRCNVLMIIESDTFKMNCPDDGIASARKILKLPIVAVNAKRIRPVFMFPDAGHILVF